MSDTETPLMWEADEYADRPCISTAVCALHGEGNTCRASGYDDCLLRVLPPAPTQPDTRDKAVEARYGNPLDDEQRASWVRGIGSALRDEAVFRQMKPEDSSAIAKFAILARLLDDTLAHLATLRARIERDRAVVEAAGAAFASYEFRQHVLRDHSDDSIEMSESYDMLATDMSDLDAALTAREAGEDGAR